METLSQNEGTVEILWTSDHADIQGNEFVDKLAKEAAAEAAALQEDNRMVTLQDISQSARKCFVCLFVVCVGVLRRSISISVI